MNSTSFNNLVIGLLDRPELLLELVSREIISNEEEGRKEWESFLVELEREWTPKRIKDFVLERKRLLYKRSALLIKKTELENRDARTNGVSFKDRQKFARKINAGYGYVRQLKIDAAKAKMTDYSVRTMVTPSDFSIISRMGFEEFLRMFY